VAPLYVHASGSGKVLFRLRIAKAASVAYDLSVNTPLAPPRPAMLRLPGSVLRFAWLLGAVCGFSGVLHAQAAAADTNAKPPFPESWINGSRSTEPQMQVQRYDADTYVIRQSVRTNIEAPFIYLFFGTHKVLQIDSGAGGLKIRPTIDKVIADWLQAKRLKSITLVVAHSHAHDDHVAGDSEFAGRPDTFVIGHKPEEVAAFFSISAWPQSIAQYDLGGRTLDIIPSPGHEPAEITVFDERTGILMMGDELYPGRLYVEVAQFHTYRSTIDRVFDFTRSKQVSWVMGCHIEMTRKPGRDYPFDAASHPVEHRLELPYADFLELHAAVDKMGDKPQLEVHKDFIFYPLP
jgi:glyoxylase-like metal-dependent hydrolase (beta-lactamase superfamily II)